MRPVCRFGDIFEVKLDDGRRRFFQFVCRDLEQLNSDVIRVFKHTYLKTDFPDCQDIISDEIECYTHTSVYAGAKYGFWSKYGKSHDVGSLDVYFRDSNDYGFRVDEPHIVKKSFRWYVWKINEERKFVGHLRKKYHCAYQGLVMAPIHVANAIKKQEPIVPRYYPIY